MAVWTTQRVRYIVDYKPAQAWTNRAFIHLETAQAFYNECLSKNTPARAIKRVITQDLLRG